MNLWPITHFQTLVNSTLYKDYASREWELYAHMHIKHSIDAMNEFLNVM